MRNLAIIGWFALASSAMAQGWSTAYDAGLTAAKASKWSEARVSFKQAVAYRPDDQSGETMLPGPIADRKKWRNGAPYSPNFLAAYAGFKQAQLLAGDDRNAVMGEVTAELEGLLAKGQNSGGAFYVLNQIFTTTSNIEKRTQLEEKFKTVGKLNWRVDGDGMAPEDVAAVAGSYQQAGVPANSGTSGVVNAGTAGAGTPVITPTTNAGAVTPVNPTIGPVAQLPNKYAIIIGNAESRLADMGLPFASDDAQRIREAFQQHGGYLETNVDLILNATAEQIRASVKAMSDRVPEDATVMLYFTGVGANLDGKDYIAGVDTLSLTDSASMVSKSEIYNAFMRKGAKVFAFFQVNRPIINGRYFGAEVPMIGRIAQVQATLPGAFIQSFIRGGKDVGLYTDSVAGVLADLRTNQIPIQEFGWQVFYRMRRAGTGNFGGGSYQTCTLPVLINIGSDAKF